MIILFYVSGFLLSRKSVLRICIHLLQIWMHRFTGTQLEFTLRQRKESKFSISVFNVFRSATLILFQPKVHLIFICREKSPSWWHIKGCLYDLQVHGGTSIVEEVGMTFFKNIINLNSWEKLYLNHWELYKRLWKILLALSHSVHW